HDWCISRQLWWGHQIPAYYCKSCGSSADPIVARSRPARCPKCGGTEFEQDPDVLDTWFSSGLWPFSTLGWPNDTAELKTFYPNAVLETGHDILFFWVARMMMLGMHFMGEVPFRVVYLHAMVRDEKGEKMSKTKGNVIDPLHVIRGAPSEELSPSLRNKFPQGMPAFGADALRFTLASMMQQGRDIKLSLERVEGYKGFANKLWNAARFALMNLGDFEPAAELATDAGFALADRWILSRLNRAIRVTTDALTRFEFAEAASTVYQFLWHEFCDWYLELSKSTLYGEDKPARRRTQAVLVHSLDRILRLLHPFMPFITEEVWQKLPLVRGVDSIMIAPYPSPHPRLDDPEAESEMTPLIEAIEGIRTIRGESNVAPSMKIQALVQSADPAVRQTIDRWRAYVMPLAGVSSLEISGPGAKQTQAAAFVGEKTGMEIFVPLAGLIDLDEERLRIAKEIERVDADIEAVRRKFENPNFASKAPREVVDRERARADELGTRRTKLQENLNRIR
ncbi:MAG TPA: class I tRNA ligase family protein, partial [Myxococcaceae bacterium]|nr:class I tRNA ligase family protein [Myxococcaceae bacterium]